MKKAKERLGIPAQLKVYQRMAVGTPDIKIAPKKLRPLSEVLYYSESDNYRTYEEPRKGSPQDL